MTAIVLRAKLNKLYWTFRFSKASRPLYWFMTWIVLIINARKTALILCECLDEIGSMRHVPDTVDVLEFRMKSAPRRDIIHRARAVLPNWKWRD